MQLQRLHARLPETRAFYPAAGRIAEGVCMNAIFFLADDSCADTKHTLDAIGAGAIKPGT